LIACAASAAVIWITFKTMSLMIRRSFGAARAETTPLSGRDRLV